MKKAAIIGGVACDQLVEVPDGGTGAGKALNLARLGVETRLHALLGDDTPGALARGALTEAGVSLTAWTDPAGTERHLMDPRVNAEELAELAGGADVVFVSLTDYSRRVLPLLRGAGVEVWVDLHDWDGEPSEVHRPFVESASCLFLDDIELDNPLRTAERLLPGKELVVLTHGKRGATAFFPDTEPLFVPPYDAGPVVDRDGAEDAFCAGVAYGRMLGWDWPRALHAGAVVAGGCVTVAGPADPALTPAWVESRL